MEPLPSELMHSILHTGRLVDALVREQLAPTGIPHGQARLLEALDHTGSIRLTDLAARLGIAGATATEMSKRMETAGLISRTRGAADDRVVVLSLTDQGKRSVHDVRRAWSAVDHQLSTALGAKAVPTLDGLKTLVRALGGLPPPGLVEVSASRWPLHVSTQVDSRSQSSRGSQSSKRSREEAP